MELIKYEAARNALQAANSIDEVKSIKDKVEALRHYAKQSKDFDMANWAAEIRIRAERRMGEMIRANKEAELMNKGGGDNRKKGEKHRLHDVTGEKLKLSDIGVTKSMSSRSQAIAEVDEEEFEAVIAEHKEQQKELTSNTIKQLTQKKRRKEKVRDISEKNTKILDHLVIGNEGYFSFKDDGLL